MFKLAKVGVAAVLGLTLVLSIFCPGAFAQSVTHSNAHTVLHRAVTLDQSHGTNGHWTDAHGHENNWRGNGWHHGHGRCVRVVRWVGWRHSAHPVVSWVCRR